jgi:SAM-dependent methyltransferase
MSIYDNHQIIKQYTDLISDNYQIHISLVKQILSKIKNLKDIRYHRILDIGCGLSPLLPIIISELSDNIDIKPILYYQGIDNSVQMIEKATHITKHLSSPNIQIEYKLCDIMTLNQQIEFPWYDIIIIQNYVHLILDKSNLCNLLNFVSKSLINNGVFYISTKTSVNKIKNVCCEYQLDSDICMVKKTEGISYLRRIFTDQSFDEMILQIFKSENTYDLDVFHAIDSKSNDFINVIGYKNTTKMYDKYKYIIGYEPFFKDLSKILDICNSEVIKEYVSDLNTMEIIRKEAILMDLYLTNKQQFIQIMNHIQQIISEILPGYQVIYLKDKLNINLKGWKFPLHQDASAKWNEKSLYKKIITIGIPITNITDESMGPTRICIRHDYKEYIVPQTQSNNVIDLTLCADGLKPLQYLNCFGIAGNYYLFDQYVLHDSRICETDVQPRTVWFITCALSDIIYESMIDNICIADAYYKQKKVLDKKEIIRLLNIGYNKTDFITDKFGKILLKI